MIDRKSHERCDLISKRNNDNKNDDHPGRTSIGRSRSNNKRRRLRHHGGGWLVVMVVFLFQIPPSSSSSPSLPSSTQPTRRTNLPHRSNHRPQHRTPPTAFQTFPTIPKTPNLKPPPTKPPPPPPPAPRLPSTPTPPTPTPTLLQSTLQNSGIFLAFFIIIALAITTESTSLKEPIPLTENPLLLDEVARETFTNVVTTAVPSSSTDLISATLGESIGGVLGASAEIFVRMVGVMGSEGVGTVTGARGGMTAGEMGRMRGSLITEAIADGDYFIANSAGRALFEAVGVTPAVASVASVVVASVPSQVVKALGRGEVRRREERERVLREELLREEEERVRRSKWPFWLGDGGRKGRGGSLLGSSSSLSSKAREKAAAEPSETNTGLSNIDLVEVFSDCTRWLAYDVLRTDFGDSILIWDGLVLDTTLTGVLFGTIAAISSQLYADVLYGVFRYGPERRREALKNRTTRDTVALYTSRCVSTSTLFGVYEFVQGPVGRYIQGTLAGGVDGCVGSSDFEICLQSYIELNAPGPSAEAQFRALVVNLGMVGQRLQDIAGDTSWDDLVMLVKSWYGS